MANTPVRQYIGARYVPLFANPAEWDNQRTYEPLTIVTHQGNSYTSRQYVPSGTDINNTDFWALTGNYNAQVEAYRQEVQNFNARITSNTNNITTNTNNINDINANLTALGVTDTETATQLKTKINNKLDSIHGTHAVWLGDSITEGYLAGDNPYRKIINDMFNFTPHNYYKGGTGWFSSNAPSFPTQADNAIADTSYDHTKVSSIFLLGGVNDFPTSDDNIAQIRNNVTTTCKKLLTSFPNATIYLGSYLGGQFNETYTVLNPRKQQTHRAILEGGINTANSRVRTFSCAKWIGWLKSLYNDDGLHPNAEGHKKIAQALLEVIQGNTTPYIQPKRQFDITPDLDETIVSYCDSNSSNYLRITIQFDRTLTTNDFTNNTLDFTILLPEWIKLPTGTYNLVKMLTNASGNYTAQTNGYTILKTASNNSASINIHQTKDTSYTVGSKYRFNFEFDVIILT